MYNGWDRKRTRKEPVGRQERTTGMILQGCCNIYFLKRARLRRYGWTSGGGYDILRFLKEREIP